MIIRERFRWGNIRQSTSTRFFLSFNMLVRLFRHFFDATLPLANIFAIQLDQVLFFNVSLQGILVLEAAGSTTDDPTHMQCAVLLHRWIYRS